MNALSSAVAAADSSQAEFFDSRMKNLSENASLSERLLYGLEIAAIGMIVVFLILLIIWAVLYLFSLFFRKKADTPDTPQPAVEEAEAKPVSDRKSADSLTDEETAVAVATAAIAASRGEEKCAFNVISITKIQK